MKLKKTFLALAIIIFMVFSLSFVTSDSLAYWANGVTITQGSQTSTVTIGTWILPWDINTSYLAGDQVTNNGVTYQAKKDNPTKEPGVDSGWTSEWTAL